MIKYISKKHLVLKQPAENNPMTIGVDCDQVVFPLIDSHLIFLNRKYGFNLRPEDIVTYDFWELYGHTKAQATEDFLEFTRAPEFLEIKPVEGSVEGVRALRELDDLAVVTSRQHELRPITCAYFDRYFKDLFSKMLFSNAFSNYGTQTSKRRLIRENNIWLHIDDHLETCEDVAQDIPVIMFDMPYNQGPAGPNITRVKNWKEAVPVARELHKRKQIYQKTSK